MNATFPAHTDLPRLRREGDTTDALARRDLPHELPALVVDGDEAVSTAHSQRAIKRERYCRDSSCPLDRAAELPALGRVVERDAPVVGADGYGLLARMPGHAIDGVVAALQD